MSSVDVQDVPKVSICNILNNKICEFSMHGYVLSFFFGNNLSLLFFCWGKEELHKDHLKEHI